MCAKGLCHCFFCLDFWGENMNEARHANIAGCFCFRSWRNGTFYTSELEV